jgi:phenylpropionate dioxygenase-like ring-hydroxylating dioxygenase large terminal subunit
MDRLLASRERHGFEAPPWQATLEATSYQSIGQLEKERASIFATFPLAVGHVSELPQKGDYLTTSAAGRPLIVLRDDQGQVRAFLNACRHRGAQLLSEPKGTVKKRLVCPYHAWSYGLSGELLHVPRQEAFPRLDQAVSGLVALPTSVRHGFIWVVPSPNATVEIGRYLGGLDEDLAGLGLDAHVALKKVTRRGRANWKLLIDAFLEGYHARFLHQRSLGRFFSDEVIYDLFGRHVRSCGARVELKGLPAIARESWDLRATTTLFYFLFPNTILVFHPDWVTFLSVFPESAGELSYTHTMLVAPDRLGEADRPRLEKSFQLIEETVFAREDLAMAESIQRSLGSGANRQFQVGSLERPLWAFHQSIESALLAAEPVGHQVGLAVLGKEPAFSR